MRSLTWKLYFRLRKWVVPTLLYSTSRGQCSLKICFFLSFLLHCVLNLLCVSQVWIFFPCHQHECLLERAEARTLQQEWRITRWGRGGGGGERGMNGEMEGRERVSTGCTEDSRTAGSEKCRRMDGEMNEGEVRWRSRRCEKYWQESEKNGK